LPVVAVLAAVSQAVSVGLRLMFVEVFVIGGPALLLARLTRLDLRETFSLRTPRGVDIPLALVAGVGGWVLASQGTYWLGDALGCDGRTIAMMRPIDPLLVVAITVFAPLEEVLFRGFVLSGLRSSYRPLHAMLLTAVLFGLFHQDASVIPGAIFLGVIYGTIVLRTGSLFPAMLAHGANNLCAGLLSHSEWGVAARSPLQLLAATAVVAACLYAMRRGVGRVAHTGPERPRFPLGFYAFAVAICVGTFVALPFQLQAMLYAEAFGQGGTLQHDHYAMRDDYSYRKESTVILLGDGVSSWAEQGCRIRITPGERLIEVRGGGKHLPHTVADDGSTATIEFPAEPHDASRFVMVSEGSFDPAGPYHFPTYFSLPGTALKLTVDLRDAPGLQFHDSRFRVKSPMLFTLFDADTWDEDCGYCIVPLQAR
jgi:membrane protease YdiL (CAAX protease family)